jgi:hypothetical protein
MASTLDLLHHLIRRQIDVIKMPVTNLYGATAGTEVVAPTGVTGAWQVWSVPQEVTELEQFFAAYRLAESATTWAAPTTGGTVVIPAALALATTATTYLLAGQITVSAMTVIPMAIVLDSQQSWVAVYVDGVLQRRGNGSLELRLSVDGGVHVIELLVKATQVGVAIPSSVPLSAGEAIPVPTGLVATPGTNSGGGSAYVLLTWYNSARAGGWRVWRRQITGLGVLSAFGAVSSLGVFSVQIAGDQTLVLDEGSELYANRTLMGTVVARLEYDAVALTTTVSVRLADTLSGIDSDWANRTAGTGHATEVARVTRSSSGQTVSWTDTAVTHGEGYDYALQAFGLVDESVWGTRGDWVPVIVGDITPPLVIEFVTGYPRIQEQLVVAKFRTPVDEDYAGVRVYYVDEPVTGTASGAGSGDNTLADTDAAGWTTNSLYNNYYVEITGGTGSGQVMLITGTIMSGVTAPYTSALTVEANWSTKPAVDSAYRIVRYKSVITDYGLPNSRDELKFAPVGTGRYVFRAFDVAGNEQLIGDAAFWDTTALEPPRTTVTIRDIDEKGFASSEQVGVATSCYPPFAVLKSGTVGAGSSTSAVNTSALGDTSCWATDDAAYVYYYVRIMHADPTTGRITTVVRKISDNTSTTLTLATALASAPVAGDTYEIVNGATMRQWMWKSTSVFVPTADMEYQRRPYRSKDGIESLVLNFYSELTGFPAEATKAVSIDRDTFPECTAALREFPAGCIEVTIVPDDDVTDWWVYARKGASPFAGASIVEWDGFKRGEYPATKTIFSMSPVLSGDATWYAGVIPRSSLNELGVPTVTIPASIELTGVADDTPTLSALSVESVSNGGVDYNRLKWSHNASAEIGGSPLATVRIYAYRTDQGSGSKVELTPVSPARSAGYDSETGTSEYSNDDDTGTADLVGSFIHELAEQRGSGVSRCWNYEILLWQDGQLCDTYKLSRTEEFVVGSNPPSITGCSVASVLEGSKNEYGICETAHQLQVIWDVSNPDPSYYLNIEIAKVVSPVESDFNVLVSGLSIYEYQYQHVEWRKCAGGGSTEYWTYRVAVMSDGTTVSSSAASATHSCATGSCNYNDQ